MSMLFKLIKDIGTRVDEGIRGRLDFFRHKNLQYSWGGPFNGQRFRQRIFFELLYYFPITAIVETGTFLGTTTSLFGATCLPVYTTEINPRYIAYSKTRFLFNRANIHLYERESRSFLRELGDDGAVPKENVFFYLDAHWGSDLPLRDELEIIFTKWKRSIVMIDDFQVPNCDYGFDNYGPGNVLNLDYIDPVVSAHKLFVFFPAAPPAGESGARRGSVVLCQEEAGLEMEARMTTLVRARIHRQHVDEG